MQKMLHINADKCTGCMQCEMACAFENYGTFATAKSRIKVFDFTIPARKCPTPAPSATRPGACMPAR
jgi:Fe-S-cluster-containing dehydrogenase component